MSHSWYDREYAGVFDDSNPFANEAYREADPNDIDRTVRVAQVRAGASILDTIRKPDPARAKALAAWIDDVVVRGLILFPPQVYYAFAGRQ